MEIAMVIVPTEETALAGMITEAAVAEGIKSGCVGVPLIKMVELERKLLPLSSRIKFGAPTVTALGEVLLRTGTGFTTGNVSELEAMDCEAGSRTVIVRARATVRLAAGIVN